MLDSKFWLAAAERAVKTFAQTLVSLMGAGAVNILTLDWGQSLSVSAGAAFMSVLTSVASYKVGAAGPSLVGEGSN